MVDASVALAWALQDEGQAGPARDVLVTVAMVGAVVPGHWRAEVGNGLIVALRRQRLTLDRLPEVMAEFATLTVEQDAQGMDAAWEEPLRLALTEGLTLYDALYLELALRRGLPLASFDKALLRAARRSNIETLPG